MNYYTTNQKYPGAQYIRTVTKCSKAMRTTILTNLYESYTERSKGRQRIDDITLKK